MLIWNSERRAKTCSQSTQHPFFHSITFLLFHSSHRIECFVFARTMKCFKSPKRYFSCIEMRQDRTRSSSSTSRRGKEGDAKSRCGLLVQYLLECNDAQYTNCTDNVKIDQWITSNL